MAKDFCYSKSNPFGPYGSNDRPTLGAGSDAGAKPTYREGFSTRKDIKEWAARVSANSGPGLVLDSAQATKRATRDRGRVEQDRNHAEPPHRNRIGWVEER